MSSNFLGIDIGALTVKLALVDETGKLTKSAYKFHHGHPLRALGEVGSETLNGTKARVAITGSGANLISASNDVLSVNEVKAAIEAVSQEFPQARNFIDVGGASLTLVRLDSKGQFRSYSSNSQCAAGTGSFLDEQATRLGLTYEAISKFGGVSNPPPVATRCAVFAKSDLIHLQQAGSSKEEMWSGLCRGMTQTALQTLLKGKPLGKCTALIGGVAQNKEVIEWFKAFSDTEVITSCQAHLLGAFGAGLIARNNLNGCKEILVSDWLASQTTASDSSFHLNPGWVCPSQTDSKTVFAQKFSDKPLKLIKTKYPSFEVKESYTDSEDNEVRISELSENSSVIGFLGIDIGSTSTKLCLVNDDGRVLVDIYRKTGGDPIGATKKIFTALTEVATDYNVDLTIKGCGTTGSGRKLVGTVIGADAVVNEISAHVKGIMHVDPEIETIFEIGGQDSKYMRTRNGSIVDANMNFVCAAGTGSFVEEQTRKLGIKLNDVGDMVLDLVPPPSSDRCTVFMEQDVNKLLRSGHTAPQAMSAVMRSVVQNYLNKVVGNRHYSRTKIAFQGATARNKGLVAAFETLLDVELVVSPYCHVMGAWGVALVTAEEMKKKALYQTNFVGLDLSQRKIELSKETCSICQNNCEITSAHIEGMTHTPSWGYLCGREPDEQKMRVSQEFTLFQKRARWLVQDGAIKSQIKKQSAKKQMVVGFPRALTTYSHYPLWRRLLEGLGAKVVLMRETDRDISEKGGSLVAAEFCYPMKIAHGQADYACKSEKCEAVFIPHLIAQKTVGKQSNSFLCPYVQAFPAVIAANVNGKRKRLISPIIDQRQKLDRQVKSLHKELGPIFKKSLIQVRKAYVSALKVQENFQKKCTDEGKRLLEELVQQRDKDGHAKPGIVFIGRPYNVHDASANLGLPRKLADKGYTVFPIDMIPFEPERIHDQYQNVYWAYGQRILSVLEYIRKSDHLFPIYLTNFNCGPDSFLLSYAEEIMGDKPLLNLELDGHGADAGYITRIEAFLDVISGWKDQEDKKTVHTEAKTEANLKDYRIWIPPLHEIITSLFAAAFRGHGSFRNTRRL
jgi:predicted CoA-substrate-specific enzyme activase